MQIAAKSLKGKQTLSDGSTLVGNMLVEGYLLDEDEEYFFLGDTADFVTETIRKDEVVRMINAIEAEMEMLYGGEVPEDEEVH